MDYFVSTTGVDSNPGTEGLPFRTIQRAADLVLPGDIVNIMGGIYYEQVSILRSGQPASRIRFKPYNSAEVILDGEQTRLWCFYIEGSYIDIEDLTLREAAVDCVLIFGGDIAGAASHNVISGCIIHDWGYAGGYEMYGAAAVRTRRGPTDITIANCTISRPKYPVTGNEEAAIHFWETYGRHKVINNNINGLLADRTGFSLYDGIGGGSQVPTENGAVFQDTVIAGNIIIGAADDCVEAEGRAARIDIYDNILDSAGGRTNIGLAPVGVGPVRIYRNLLVGASDTIFKLGGRGTWPTSSGQIWIYHNTCYCHPTALSPLEGLAPNVLSRSGGPGAVRNVTCVNNIFFARRYIIEIPDPGSEIWLDSNCVYSSDRGRDGYTDPATVRFWGPIKWDGVQYSYDDWVDHVKSDNQQANGFYSLPGWANEDIADPNPFALLPESPCVDTGQNLPTYNDPGSPWPYQGAAPDIGYLESPYTGTPTAAFTATPTQGFEPLTVAFIDESLGVIDTWSWDFGDGSPFSSEQNPTHLYEVPGDYTAVLTVTGPGGPSTAQVAIRVVAYTAPIANFTATPSTGDVPLTVAFADFSEGFIDTISLDFGDGSPPAAVVPQSTVTHTYQTSGVFTATLTVTGPGGFDQATIAIGVISIPVPVVSFRAEPATGTEPLEVHFFDESTGPIDSWSWDFGDGVTSVSQNPIHIFSAGNYMVQLTVTGPGGSDSAVKSISVSPVKPEGSNVGTIVGAAAVGAIGILAIVAVTKRR